MRPLEGIRIADFTVHAAGPFSTHMLSLMGAECIKIETALRPDIFCSLPDEVPAGVSFNRGKRAVERSIAWAKECHEMHAKGMGGR